jgi:hypothetical protein
MTAAIVMPVNCVLVSMRCERRQFSEFKCEEFRWQVRIPYGGVQTTTAPQPRLADDVFIPPGDWPHLDPGRPGPNTGLGR